MKQLLAVAASVLAAALALGQAPDRAPGGFGPPPFGPGGDGPGPGFRPGGPGGMMREQLKVVAKFDKDGDRRLNAEERKAAQEFVRQERATRGPRGRGRFGPQQDEQPAAPGRHLSASDVKTYGKEPLYDTKTLRTLFLEFTETDWEQELMDFHNTDVEVPAKLMVDGRTYPDVGIHFRGASSYMMVPAGRKHSLNVSLDFAHEDQRLLGYHTLNLLNSHEDPSFLRTVLFCDIARNYVPAPKANFVRVVINGEDWGVYVNVEQFNKDFLKEWYGTGKGARWKVPGSPNGRGSLAYIGDDPQSYKRIYEIKTKDDPKAWNALIQMCKVLNETPANDLEKKVGPLLDIDGALKFLALENALIDNDGYWIRTSDYNLYEDTKGRFHVIPHDVNETFSRPGGPGFGRRGAGGGAPAEARPRINGVELDPLIAASDTNKPLASKLLAVPALRARYLAYVRDIAEKWLDWKKLGPMAEEYHALIAEAVAADTRKLDSTADFNGSLTNDIPGRGRGPGGGGTIGLKNFADQRRAYLLGYH